jgi:hypothetical protein
MKAVLVKYSGSLLTSIARCIMNLLAKDNPLGPNLEDEFRHQELIQETDGV